MNNRKLLIALAAASACLVALGLAAGCNDHTHTYSEDWTTSETQHWHAATCEHTDEVSDLADHTYDNGVVTTEATCTEAGVTTYTCTVCGYSYNEAIEAKGHTLGDWIEEIPATHTQDGSLGHYECSVCGKFFDSDLNEIEDLVIPKLEDAHTYSSKWSYDEKSHWHAATCGHNDKVSDLGEHDWDVVTLGSLTTYTCKVCGYSYSELEGGEKDNPIIIELNSEGVAQFTDRAFSSSYREEWYSFTCPQSGAYRWSGTTNSWMYLYDDINSNEILWARGSKTIYLEEGTIYYFNIYYYATDVEIPWEGSLDFTFTSLGHGQLASDPLTIESGENTVKGGGYYKYTAPENGKVTIAATSAIYVYPTNSTSNMVQGNVTDRIVYDGDTILIYISSIVDECTLSIEFTKQGSSTVFPYVAVSDLNSKTTTSESYYDEQYGCYIEFFVYQAQQAGTVTISSEDGVFVKASDDSFEALLASIDNTETVYDVSAGNNIYIIAGLEEGYGDYSFTLTFSDSGNADGSQANPYKAVEGLNSKTTTSESYIEPQGCYVEFFIYEATKTGTVTISSVKDFVCATTVSFNWTLGSPNGYYIFTPYRNDLVYEVTPGTIIYIIAGLEEGYGDYSFTLTFINNDEVEGSQDNPYIAVEGLNSKTITKESFIAPYGSYVEFYIYVASQTGTVTISTEKSCVNATTVSFDYTLTLPDGSYTLPPYYPDDLVFEVTQGTTIYIVAETSLGLSGDYSFTLTFINNDEADGSQDNPYIAVDGLNSKTITKESPNYPSIGYVEFFKYVATQTGTVTISTEESCVGATTVSFDYTLTVPAGSYILPPKTPDDLVFEVTQGTTIYILATTAMALPGDYSFTLTFSAD